MVGLVGRRSVLGACIITALTASCANQGGAYDESFVTELLHGFGDTADILMGKPIPPQAARRLLLADTNARGIQWLVDTPERLFGYAEVARSMQVRLNINLEIDVGLRRGGARDTTELLHLIEILAAHPNSLRFTGLMGYDGHVPYAPSFIGSQEAAVEEEFAAVQTLYNNFVEAARTAHPELFTEPLMFNSGGSKTYFRYGDGLTDTVVNDIAMGSGFLAPASFDDLHAKGHRPALYVASPVSKRINPGELPFVKGFQPWLAAWDPNMEVTFVMLGGGWPGDPVSPPGLRENSFLSSGSGGIRNLLSNQAILLGSEEIPLTAGDFIFFQPWEGDALVLVDSVWLLRNGKIVGQWPTYRGGN